MSDRLSASFAVVQSTTNSPRNSCPASVSSGCPSSAALSLRAASSTALPPSTVEREAVVWPVSSSRSVLTSTRMRSGGRSSSSHAICRRTVCTPWPISVQEWKSDRAVARAAGSRARTRDAVADARVLDAARDAGEPRSAIRVTHCQERLLEADPGPEYLPRAEGLARPGRSASGSPNRRSRRSASASRTPSTAKLDWLTPKPRIARRAGCSCRRPSRRRPRSAPRTRHRRARRHARAPCRRRWRRPRCRRRCERAARRGARRRRSPGCT